MNIFITRNIRFGYHQSSDGSIRKRINECLTNWIIDLVKNKSKKEDKFIIVGGLFSGTNPTLVSIRDARKFISTISEIIPVELISTSKDTRNFDGDILSTMELFSDMNNVTITDKVLEIFNIEEGKVLDKDIPNLMQLEMGERKPGILVYNTTSNKVGFIENKFSPRHVIITIENVDQLLTIESDTHKNDFLHLVINENISDEEKLKVDVAIHKLNPISVKYVEHVEKEPTSIDIGNTMNIREIIKKSIGDNQEMGVQFERILEIYSKR